LGASGGVAGIIFAYILFFPGSRIGMYFLPIGIPGWLFAIAYLLISFRGMHGGLTNVGHDAHLGGALVGLFIAAAFHPVLIRYHPWLFTMISVGTVLLFIYVAQNPLFLPLEGVDFTKEKDRSATKRWRFPSLFNFRLRNNPPSVSSHPERRVDAILQKISETGMDSLTEEEKKFLRQTSNKFRRREIRDKPKSGFPF
jgi:hypothetical protein